MLCCVVLCCVVLCCVMLCCVVLCCVVLCCVVLCCVVLLCRVVVMGEGAMFLNGFTCARTASEETHGSGKDRHRGLARARF